MHGFKAEIFHFDTDAVETQPVRNRRIDVQGFTGNAAALVGAQRPKCPHVMQTVSELDQNHANVFRHGHGHLLEIFGLLLLFVFKMDVRQFGDTIHQIRHHIAKLGGQRRLGNACVLDHIVQHGRHQALVIQVHVGEDAGDCQRMNNVGFTTAPTLAVMGLLGVVVSPAHLLDLLAAEVMRQSFGQGIKSGHEGLRRVDALSWT